MERLDPAIVAEKTLGHSVLCVFAQRSLTAVWATRLLAVLVFNERPGISLSDPSMVTICGRRA